MKFAYAITYVEDVSKTVAFYNHAFGFEIKFITPEKDYAELISGETTIAFASLELGMKNIPAGITPLNKKETPLATEWAFTSENIEADFQKALDNGAILTAPISTKPWGQKVGYLRDLNGFLIEICTPIKSK
jgi:uncharacterized glyoxalase superfamily protein PhnB